MQNKNPVIDAYSAQAEAWGDLPNFVGNFINYGYWLDILDKSQEREITYPERMTSAINLYNLLAEKINIIPSDNVLEIGCGRGMGAVHIAQTYRPGRIVGIDITGSQISLANQITSKRFREKLKISFLNVELGSSTFHESEFDKIYSVEVFQHIPLEILKSLVNIMFNILKPAGKIAITTYFTTKELPKEEIEKLFPLAKDKQEYLCSIDVFEKILKENNFKNVKAMAIGEQVFLGYERWITQQHVDTPCSHVYYDLYSKGIIDYYVLTADKA